MADSSSISFQIYAIQYPDGTPSGFDLDDFLMSDDAETAEALLEEPEEMDPPDKPNGGGDDDDEQTFTNFAVEHCCSFFHTPGREPFARILVDDGDGSGQHKENHPVQGTELWQLLAYRFHQATGQSVGSELRRQAASVCEGLALFEGEERPVFTRVARQGEEIYIDLCNSSWEVVRITPEEIEVTKDPPPALFRRSRSMLALPRPAPDGDLEELRPLLNLPEGQQGDETFKLVQGTMVTYYSGQGPYFILMVESEHGGGKTSLLKTLKFCIDPSKAPVRTLPKDEQSLLISASSGLLLAYDNISRIDPAVSDALCRLSTGSGWGARQLYTDSEEHVIEVCRPVALNSITSVIHRHDAADRSVFIKLQPIPEAKRRPERELWAAVEDARPRILMGLCKAVQQALKNEDEVRHNLTRLPRMADAAIFATAGLPEVDEHGNPVPWDQSSFLCAYNSNRAGAVEQALDSSLFASSLRRLVEFHQEWEGLPSELLIELETFVSDEIKAEDDWKKRHHWPANVKALGRQMQIHGPFLRAVNVDISPGSKGKRSKRISKVPSEIEPRCEACSYFVRTPSPGGCALKGESREPDQAACQDFEESRGSECKDKSQGE